MYLRNRSSFPVFCFTTIFLMIILLSFPFRLSSTDDGGRYKDCTPTRSCGVQWKIAYPFWDSRQPDYCGQPGFKLECVRNTTLTITIKNQTYHIISIHYEAKVLRIVEPDPYDNYCPEPEAKELLRNTTLDLDLFSLSSSSQHATFFYDCNQDFAAYEPDVMLHCSHIHNDSSSNSSDGYLIFNPLKRQKFKTACSIEVFTSVLKSAIIYLNKGDPLDSFLKGFEIEWKVDENDQCEDCVNSGGRCGFDHTLNQQVCFCNDGQYHKTCGKSKTQTRQIIIATVVIAGIATVMGIVYCLWRHIGPRYGVKVMSKKTLQNITVEANGTEANIDDLPLLRFEELALATNNFQDNNKIGQGGFGPVYKGNMENEIEVAVKRLSRASGQGQQEFLNEVLLISKLQHKNLVKLLGCCVEGDEKLLVYEFMPNKSLDALLFDPIEREQLGWNMRYGIIKGICRGVLYLHKDSRLKIIHRDLKPSNILLDKEFNPKISDFGMARIFGGKQDQANTLRVVGTYGYMSPEYAMDGRFSEKSDVYSLGVLLLEIVCGRRNAIINDDSMSLISYVWKLWNEDNILSLIDPIISEPCFHGEIMRSIHVGLFCVQELPQDGPSISTIISMLDYDVIDLPHPLQPGFTQDRCFLEITNVHRHYQQKWSLNHVSISSLHGR